MRGWGPPSFNSFGDMQSGPHALVVSISLRTSLTSSAVIRISLSILLGMSQGGRVA